MSLMSLGRRYVNLQLRLKAMQNDDVLQGIKAQIKNVAFPLFANMGLPRMGVAAKMGAGAVSLQLAACVTSGLRFYLSVR